MDRYGVRRQDAALGPRRVAARESAVMPAHSKKVRWQLGMEFGDKANGRGTALVSALRGKIRAIAPRHAAASCIIFDFWCRQDCKGPGGGLS